MLTLLNKSSYSLYAIINILYLQNYITTTIQTATVQIYKYYVEGNRFARNIVI